MTILPKPINLRTTKYSQDTDYHRDKLTVSTSVDEKMKFISIEDEEDNDSLPLLSSSTTTTSNSVIMCNVFFSEDYDDAVEVVAPGLMEPNSIKHHKSLKNQKLQRRENNKERNGDDCGVISKNLVSSAPKQLSQICHGGWDFRSIKSSDTTASSGSSSPLSFSNPNRSFGNDGCYSEGDWTNCHIFSAGTMASHSTNVVQLNSNSGIEVIVTTCHNEDQDKLPKMIQPDTVKSDSGKRTVSTKSYNLLPAPLHEPPKQEQQMKSSIPRHPSNTMSSYISKNSSKTLVGLANFERPTLGLSTLKYLELQRQQNHQQQEQKRLLPAKPKASLQTKKQRSLEQNFLFNNTLSLPASPSQPSTPRLWRYSSNHVMINQERVIRNIPQMVRLKELDALAKIRAEQMASTGKLFYADIGQLKYHPSLERMFVPNMSKNYYNYDDEDDDGSGLLPKMVPEIVVVDIAENIARGSSIRDIHDAMMSTKFQATHGRIPREQSTLLDPRFTHMGMATASCRSHTSTNSDLSNPRMLVLCQILIRLEVKESIARQVSV